MKNKDKDVTEELWNFMYEPLCFACVLCCLCNTYEFWPVLGSN